MKRIKGLLCLIVFLIVILLPVNVFGEDDFISSIVNEQVEITKESSIFDLTVHITRQSIDIMNSTTDHDKAVELLDELLEEYEFKYEIDAENLLNLYLYYEEYFKEDFEEDPKEYIEYNREDEVFSLISSYILNTVSDRIEDVADDPESDLEAVNLINGILDKYNLKNDLDANAIIYRYHNKRGYSVYHEIRNIFTNYEFEQRIHYKIKELVNEINDLKSEDEIINVINKLLEDLQIEDSIESKEILNTYKNFQKYSYDTKEEALHETIMKIKKNNKVKEKIHNICKEIVDEINEVVQDSRVENVYDLLRAHGLGSIISGYDLIKIYNNYQEHGYENEEDAILKEGLKALEISYSEKTVNDIIDRIIKVIDIEVDNYPEINDLDEKSKQMIYEEIYYNLNDTFEDYDIKDNISSEKIMEAYSNYAQQGYSNYEDAVIAAATEMFKGTKLQEEIIDIIDNASDITEIGAIREEISDYIEESDFEKYIDYNAINEIIKSDAKDNISEAISDIMINAIVTSNKEDILEILDDIVDEIVYNAEKAIEREKSKQILDILKGYNLEDCIDLYEVFELSDYYKELEYSSPEEAIFEGLFKQFTKSYSEEEKVNIKNKIVKVISEEKTYNINSDFNMDYIINKILERDNLDNYILPKDILNIYYHYEAYGYNSMEEGIIDEIIKGTIKRIEQNVIKVIGSGKIEENIKKRINRILKSNDLELEIDAVRIIDIYNNYKEYGLNSSTEALSQELEKLFDFVKESTEPVLE